MRDRTTKSSPRIITRGRARWEAQPTRGSEIWRRELFGRQLPLGSEAGGASGRAADAGISVSDGEQCWFMNPESYEQIEISNAAVGPYLAFLEPGMKLNVEFVEEQPAGVLFPEMLEVRIADTASPMHSPDNRLKPATLERERGDGSAVREDRRRDPARFAKYEVYGSGQNEHENEARVNAASAAPRRTRPIAAEKLGAFLGVPRVPQISKLEQGWVNRDGHDHPYHGALTADASTTCVENTGLRIGSSGRTRTYNPSVNS